MRVLINRSIGPMDDRESSIVAVSCRPTAYQDSPSSFALLRDGAAALPGADPAAAALAVGRGQERRLGQRRREWSMSTLLGLRLI